MENRRTNCSTISSKRRGIVVVGVFALLLSIIGWICVEPSVSEVVKELRTSRYEEGPCLAKLFLSLHDRRQLQVKVGGSTLPTLNNLEINIEQYKSILFDRENDYLLTYIKIADGIVLTDSLLEQIASAFEYNDQYVKKTTNFDKNFIPQYGTNNRIFKVLVTPKVILSFASSFRMNSLHIEWIRRVPTSHRISIPISDVLSFNRAPLLIETAHGFSERKLSSWLKGEVNKRVRKTVRSMSESEISEVSRVRGLESTLESNTEWMNQELSGKFDFSLIQLLHPRNKLFSLSPSQFVELESLPNRNRRMIDNLNTELAQSLYEKLASDESILQVSRATETQLFDIGMNNVIQGGRVEELGDIIWESGITGKGQVVSYIDTGISVEHCSFYDKNATNYTSINFSHKKVIGIEGSDMIDTNGHGTHVAGVIAGDISLKYSGQGMWKGNGVAKNAKLYVIDFSSSADGTVDANYDLQGMLKRAYNLAGSRIHSNSWGCKPGHYDCDYNRICYRLKLNGQRGARVNDTECIAERGVKCHQECLGYSDQASLMDQFLYDHDDMIIVQASGNNGNISLLESIAAPSTAKNLLSVGAVHNYYTSYCNSTSMSASKCEKTYYDFSMGMPLFSGKGPTMDGRNKPDVVAPGHFIMSSTRGTSCDFGAKSGTSFATPGVAASAALVREYLTTNDYERLRYFNLNNTLGENETMSVSGTLIKAFLIHSALPVEGAVYPSLQEKIDISSYSGPNPIYGYGTVSLDTVLKFSNPDTLRVLNRQSISPGQTQAYTFLFKAKNAVKITLTWYDRASQQDMVSNVTKLINDLDLSVKCTGGDEYLGNGKLDKLNTVEQVYFSTKSDVCTISVKASEMNIGNQKFSMVISSTYNIEQTQLEVIVNKASNSFSFLLVAFLMILTFVL